MVAANTEISEIREHLECLMINSNYSLVDLITYLDLQLDILEIVCIEISRADMVGELIYLCDQMSAYN